MKNNLRSALLVLTLLAAFSAAAMPVDTTLKADGGEPMPLCSPGSKCPIIK